MSNIFVAAYDGSEASNRAVHFAIERAKITGSSLIVAFVLEWSPYSFLTPEEIAERHVRRKEELQRAEDAIIAPLMEQLREEHANVPVSAMVKFGHPVETLINIITESGATQVFIGRTGHSSVVSRIFGSVTGSLAQVSPVPCTIVP